MKLQITPFAYMASITTALLGLLSWYLWRKSQTSETLLAQGAAGFEALRRENQQLKAELMALQAEFEGLRETAGTAREAIDQARKASASAEARASQLEADAAQARKRMVFERDQFIAQLESANEQIAMLSARAPVVKEVEAPVNVELQQENQKLRDNLKDAQARLSGLQSRLDEMATFKRRNAQLDRLYQSMRSLKEMAEERNTNWEHALRDLSSWTLTEKKRMRPETVARMTLGEQVGTALEAIGKSLVEVDSADTTESAGNAAPVTIASTVTNQESETV
ncbi:MAG: hypothetical protein RIQ81_1051 [Pseudomonadota bacterium]